LEEFTVSLFREIHFSSTALKIKVASSSERLVAISGTNLHDIIHEKTNLIDTNYRISKREEVLKNVIIK
jgi:hypothetical protein